MNLVAMDLNWKILKTNPNERISLIGILNHSFFNQYFANPTSCLIKPDKKNIKLLLLAKIILLLGILMKIMEDDKI